jgi:hypothetical protein
VWLNTSLYHSVNFGCTIFAPSQTYNVYLVKEGLKRNAFIIQMRSRRVWQSAILGLGSYLNYHELKNPQNPTISGNNCPGGFPEILKILGKIALLPLAMWKNTYLIQKIITKNVVRYCGMWDGALFSGIAGDSMQRVVLCFVRCALKG